MSSAEPEARRSGRIQAVDRAAGILRALATGTPTLGVTEIADRIGLAKPTVYGLLRTLEYNGLVRQDPDSGKYSLGPGVLQLGNAYLAGSELRTRSMLRAAALARQVNEAVWVAVLAETPPAPEPSKTSRLPPMNPPRPNAVRIPCVGV